MAVFGTVEARDFVFARTNAEARQVHRVGTHIGDVSAFIEALRHHHRLRNRKTEFAGGFLLQGRSGERRCRRAFQGLFRDALHREFGIATLLEEGQCLVVGLETGRERGGNLLWIVAAAREHEFSRDVVVGFALEVLDFALALDNQSHGNALHATCRQRGFYFAPQHGRNLEAHQSVEHATSLLRVHKVHVDVARMLDGVENRRFRDFVEHNAVCIFLVESQHFAKVPRNGFSLAVFIACEPNFLGFLCVLSQVCNDFFLFLGNFVVGLQCA